MRWSSSLSHAKWHRSGILTGSLFYPLPYADTKDRAPHFCRYRPSQINPASQSDTTTVEVTVSPPPGDRDRGEGEEEMGVCPRRRRLSRLRPRSAALAPARVGAWG